MQDNLNTTCAVSLEKGDTQSPDRVSLSRLAYDLSDFGGADFELVRYVPDSFLAETLPAKCLLIFLNHSGNRRVINVFYPTLSTAASLYSKPE